MSQTVPPTMFVRPAPSSGSAGTRGRTLAPGPCPGPAPIVVGKLGGHGGLAGRMCWGVGWYGPIYLNIHTALKGVYSDEVKKALRSE